MIMIWLLKSFGQTSIKGMKMNAAKLAELLNTLTRYDHATDFGLYGSCSYMESDELGEWVKLEDVLTLLNMKMGSGENWNKIEAKE